MDYELSAHGPSNIAKIYHLTEPRLIPQKVGINAWGQLIRPKKGIIPATELERPRGDLHIRTSGSRLCAANRTAVTPTTIPRHDMRDVDC